VAKKTQRMYLISGCIWDVIHAVWNIISWSHKSWQHLYSLLTKTNPVSRIQKILVKNKSAKITRFRGDLFLKLPNLAKSSCAMPTSPQKKGKEKKKPSDPV